MTPSLYLSRFDSPLLDTWQAAQIARLTSTELSRLARINRPQRREQFVVGHCVLRQGLTAAGLEDATIEVDAAGRVLVQASVPLYASIAHAETAVAVMISGSPVGVDLESMKPTRDPRAAAELLGLPADRAGDANAVLRAWVIAEARLKAGPPAGEPIWLPTWLSVWEGCQLAVAGTPSPPVTGVFDGTTGIYNATELQWEAF